MKMHDFFSEYAEHVEHCSCSLAQCIQIINNAWQRENTSLPSACKVRWQDDTSARESYRRLFRLLWPRDLDGHQKIRVGSERDGGYIQLDTGENGVAWSLGVSRYSPWDLEMANRGYQVFQFDGTIDIPPDQHSNLHFYKMNIGPATNREKNIIGINDVHDFLGKPEMENMILQMDIENAEWDVLEAMEAKTFSRFRQVIIEFHFMKNFDRLPRYERIFTKLCSIFEPVHLHYNNYAPLIGFADFLIADAWELTFARKDLGIFSLSDAIYPTPLDRPNNPAWPDIYIGAFENLAK